MTLRRLPIVPREVAVANCRLSHRLSDYHMSLRAYKAAKSLIVSVFVLAAGTHSLVEGGDPTAIGLATLAALIVINGFEISEWMAAKEELTRLRDRRDDD